MEENQASPDSKAPSPKKMRVTAKEEAVTVPQSVVVQFMSTEGEATGPQIDLPTDSTIQQMEDLLNQLRGASDVKVSLPFHYIPYECKGTGGGGLYMEGKVTPTTVSGH